MTTTRASAREKAKAAWTAYCKVERPGVPFTEYYNGAMDAAVDAALSSLLDELIERAEREFQKVVDLLPKLAEGSVARDALIYVRNDWVFLGNWLRAQKSALQSKDKNDG